MIWVHDYQLQLVPAMVRELRPDATIGFFLHIPFPPWELFARLPWRNEIIEGLLGADLVGFQRLMGAENFASSPSASGCWPSRRPATSPCTNRTSPPCW